MAFFHISPWCLLQFPSPPHEHCLSHSSQSYCSKGWQLWRRGQKERNQGWLKHFILQRSRRPLCCQVGYCLAVVEKVNNQPLKNHCRRTISNSWKGLGTCYDQARMNSYKKEVILNIFIYVSIYLFGGKGVLAVCFLLTYCCRIRKVTNSTPPAFPITHKRNASSTYKCFLGFVF